MPQICVSAYRISLKVPQKSVFYDLNSKILSYSNVVELFSAFVQKNEEFQTKKDKEYTFRLETVRSEMSDKKYYYFFGRIRTGQYGRESEVVNTETGVVEFKLKPAHAEVLPFDFFLIVPKEPQKYGTPINNGLVLFESNGGRSARYQFMKALKDFARSESNTYCVEHPDKPEKVIIDVSPMINADALKRIWEESVVKKLTLTKMISSIDSSDEGSAKESRVFSKIDQLFLKKIGLDKVFLNGGLINIQTKDNFDYDEAKVELEEKGTKKHRTYKLGKMDSALTSEVMPTECVGADGHPLEREALEFYLDIGKYYLGQMPVQN